MIHRNLTQHTQLDELFFPVVDKPIAADLDNSTTLKKTIYLPIQDKVVYQGDASYKFIKNEDIVRPVYEQLVADFGVEQIQTKIESYQDRRFYFSFRLLNQLHPIAKNDLVYPEILIHNSYDKSIVSSATFGFVRQICTNGMMGFHQAETIQLQQSDKFDPAQLVPIFLKLATIEPSLVYLKELTKYPVSRPQLSLIRRAMLDLHRRNRDRFRFTEDSVERALRVARREARVLNSPLNAWLLYNGFNHQLNHEETSHLLPEEVRQIDEQVLTIIKAFTVNDPRYFTRKEAFARRNQRKSVNPKMEREAMIF